MSDRADPRLEPEISHGLSAGQRGRMIRIGLTGPIGCGKSTVAGWLADLGARVIDADQVARGVTPPGSPGLAAVVEAFGDGILRADGTLDRAALARIVFADPVALRRLEAIIHPAVRPPILEQIAGAEREGAVAVVVEAIKLVDGGLAALCDEVWLITCEPAEQRGRLIERARARMAGRDPDRADVAADADLRAADHIEARLEADAEARIAAQADLVARLRPHATRIIDTTGTIAESRSRVLAAWRAATQSPPPLEPGLRGGG
ncbi:MAG TPA: dephospho-CoA kinase [Candidatus Limnocylindria bacterium]|nr:dephospho-CoA kinase [Candidatus Limnocylindria bacterium]